MGKGARERERLFHYAAGVGDEPLRNSSEKMSTDESLDTRPLKRKSEFDSPEQQSLYKLAEQRARLAEIAKEYHDMLEKFSVFMGDSEKAKRADLCKRLSELTED